MSSLFKSDNKLVALVPLSDMVKVFEELADFEYFIENSVLVAPIVNWKIIGLDDYQGEIIGKIHYSLIHFGIAMTQHWRICLKQTIQLKGGITVSIPYFELLIHQYGNLLIL